MSSGRRGGRGHEEEHENHERWAVSYADMMTVLVALFIVMYAMSTVDQTKFEELRQSLAVGFGAAGTSIVQGSTGAMAGQDSYQIAPDFTTVTDVTGSEGEGGGEAPVSADATAYLEAAREYEQLSDITERLTAMLEKEGLAAHVSFRVDERGLIIGLVGSSVFFAADDAALTPVANRVVDTLAGPLREQSRQLSIEGHANVLPSSRYASNWELSSARATQVLRRFVESGRIEPTVVGATGYGDARPMADGSSASALEANRRVDIVVGTAISEEARALLPQIAAAIDSGDITADELHRQIETARTIQGETV